MVSVKVNIYDIELGKTDVICSSTRLSVGIPALAGEIRYNHLNQR